MNPSDAWALQREADISLLKREYDQAIELLKAIPVDQIAADQLPHYRQQMIACLTELVRSDFPNRQREVAELVKFAQSPAERLHARRLTAEQHESLKQYQDAFDIYWSLAAEDGRQLVERNGDSKISLPLDRWLAGRIGDLWQHMDADSRQKASDQIAERAKNLGEDFKALERLRPSTVFTLKVGRCGSSWPNCTPNRANSPPHNTICCNSHIQPMKLLLRTRSTDSPS